jgi:hypothetical protein
MKVFNLIVLALPIELDLLTKLIHGLSEHILPKQVIILKKILLIHMKQRSELDFRKLER